MSASRSSRGSRPLAIAHRGASGQRPENTLAAFELAVEQRADMIEIDLHRCADGDIVIRHDEELLSLGGSGEIADSTLTEIRLLDAGDGERIPTLDAVLDGFGQRIPFNLEIKRGTAGEYEGLESETLRAVSARGLLDGTLFSSFYDGVLRRLREQEQRARLAVLVSPRRPEQIFERAEAVAAEAVNPWHGLATPELVTEAHARGLAVYPYTVDDPEVMRRLLDDGVDGMFTNFPERLLALL
jgi:glycerophosphoryl diester phosphodiesterase